MSKYGHRPHNWFEAIVNKLGGEEAGDAFLRGELAVQAAASGWKIWKSLKIGGISKEVLLAEIERRGFRVSSYAREMMAKISTLAKPRTVKLVRVTPKDIGFTEMPTTTELFARAKERGLDPCPAEVGPHLRLAFPDQPKGDWFWVAMEPITGSGGYPGVFDLGSDDGGRWLHADCANPTDRWDLSLGLVFLLRK